MTDESADSRWFGLGLPNLVVLGLAVVAIVVGYVLLDRGSVTAAPVLLVVGYVILIPLALLLGYRRLGGAGEEGASDADGGRGDVAGRDRGKARAKGEG